MEKVLQSFLVNLCYMKTNTNLIGKGHDPKKQFKNCTRETQSYLIRIIDKLLKFTCSQKNFFLKKKSIGLFV